MKLSNLNIGIIHSIVGKNDGVSIVIDQTVRAMVEYMGIPLGNFYFLAAYAPPRFNTTLNEILWHKNDINRNAVKNFRTDPPPEKLEKQLEKAANDSKRIIGNFIEKNHIDLVIAHNTCHPYNFTTAMGLGRYFEEKRRKGIIWPRYMVWWHDSFYERKIFENPNSIIRKYLKYLPGTNIDGILFINSQQPRLARKYYSDFKPGFDMEPFFETRTGVIPNTCDINWDWESRDWKSDKLKSPPQEQFNKTFFRDIGLEDILKKNSTSLKNAVFLLQHTRVVPRKRIDVAIDFAFRIHEKYRKDGEKNKAVVLIVSGPSGDEQSAYKEYLGEHFRKKCAENPAARVFLIFGEDRILSSRDVIVDKKFYDFSDIPSIIASRGGMGTYFSEVEGFGNNLLEMVSMGLPVIINKYDIYRSDIEKQYKFKFPALENCELTEKAVHESYRLLTDTKHRNSIVQHNLKILSTKLSHHVIADKLAGVMKNALIYE